MRVRVTRVEPCVIGRHSSRNDTSHRSRAQSGGTALYRGCFRQLTASTNDTVAAAEATVRTWFHTVHSRTYVGQ